MSAPGRPKRESAPKREAQRVVPMSAPGRPQARISPRSAEGSPPMSARLLERLAARTELRRAPSLLHPECPIEQAVHATQPAVHAQLMQEIWRRHSFIDEGALLVADPKSLRVLARSERALRAPIAALRERHGPSVVVEPPSVRYVHGAPVLEPYMLVLLTGPLRHLQRLQDDLARRRATITRIETRSNPFIVEAEAPLGQLLGYGDWLVDAFGDDAVDASLWLSRYRPIGADGPYAA